MVFNSTFFTEIIYFVIDKYVENIIEKNWLIISIAMFGTIAVSVLPVRLPWALDAAFVGVGLFHIGHCMYSAQKENNKYVDSLFHLNPIVWTGLAVCTIFFIRRNGYINMRNGDYAVLPWFWINAVSAILIGINFSKFCEKYGRIMKPVMVIGRNSITYVCLNQVVISVYRKVVIYIKGGAALNLVDAFFILVSVILSLMIIDFVLNKVKIFRIMLGKK